MTWDNPGSNPLSNIGESVVGDIGGTAEVRLVTSNYTVGGETYYIGLLTSNSDPNSVSIDPVTGEPSPVGTDVGFGAPLRRYVQSGIYNADFAAPPPDTSAPISDDNPLPYWRFIPSAASNVAVHWVADSTSGSGGKLRWTMTGEVDPFYGGYLEQLVPINATGGRNWTYWANAEFADETVDGRGALIAQFLRNDGTTETGDISQGTAFTGSLTATARAGNLGTAPDDAGWLRLRVGGLTSTVAAGAVNTIDLQEMWLTVGGDRIVVTDGGDPDTYGPATLKAEDGVLFLGYGDTAGASSGADLPLAISSNGRVMVGGAPTVPSSYLAKLTVDSRQSGIVGLRVSGPTTNPADLFQVDSPFAGIDPSLSVDLYGQTRITASSAGRIPLTIQGAVSQSSNLLVVEQDDGTDLVAVSAAGRVGIGVAPTNTNGGVLQLSSGITFPATAVAASDANTLDDYEEGTWTPAITFATPGNLSVTYSSQVGRYTRIGRFVFIEGFVQTSTFTHTTASGTLTVTGLPFTVVNSVPGVSGCAFRGWTDTLAWIGSRPVQNGTSVDFVASKSASVFYTVTAAIMPTGGTVDIRFQLGYVV